MILVIENWSNKIRFSFEMPYAYYKLINMYHIPIM